jgi:hypothetical protein
MKKLLFAIGLMFGAAAVVNAQDSTSTKTQTQSQTETQISNQDEQREKVSISDLPAPIKTALENKNYQNWTVSSAYKTRMTSPANTDASTDAKTDTKAQGMDLYVVELKNGAQTTTVKFDKDGKEIDKTDNQQQK